MKPRSDKHLPVETEQVYRNVDGTVAVERITRDTPPPPTLDRRKRPERRPSLAGLLVNGGFTTYEQITEALEEGLGTGERLGEVIVRRGWATQEDLAALLAEQWTVPYVDSAGLELDASAVSELPLERARELEAIPVWRDNGRLVVAFAEPADERFAKVRELLDDPAFVVVTRSVLDGLLDDPVARIVETIELVAPTPAPTAAPASPPVDLQTPLTDRLNAILAETARLETTLRQAEAELAAVRGQRARDAETIAQLQATLKLRDDLLGALRGKLTDL
jgi:Type II secretion system (T2SS), protein E, N-terminal domain